MDSAIFDKKVLMICVQKDAMRIVSSCAPKLKIDLDKITAIVDSLCVLAKAYGYSLQRIDFTESQLIIAHGVENPRLIAWALVKDMPVVRVRNILIDLAAEVAIRVI